MAYYKVVVVAENGQPLRGVTVAAYSLTNFPNIAARVNTDKSGAAAFNVTGPVFFDAFSRRGVSFRDRSYEGKVQIQVAVIGTGACYDYVVDSDGTGTHTTLFGSTGALNDAVTAGGYKSIWICDNETASGTFNTPNTYNGTVTIEAAVQRVAITLPAGAPLFTLNNSASFVGTFLWKNLRFVGNGSNGAWALANAHSGGGTFTNEFERCDFSGATNFDLYQITTNGAGPGGHTYLTNCTGTFNSLINEVAISQAQAGDCRIRASTLLFKAALGQHGGGIHTGTITIEQGSILTTTAANFITGGSFSPPVTVRGATVSHTGTGHWITNIPGGILQLENIEFKASNTNAAFINAATNGGTVLWSDLILWNTAGSALTAITLTPSPNPQTVIAGPFVCYGYAACYSGPAVSAGIPHNTLAGLTTGDDHTQYTRKDTLTTKGDIYYASGASTPARLPIGTDQVQFLGIASGVPAWQAKAPLTTKGDLYTYDTTYQRLAVGTDGQYLKADSTTATGLKWGSGGGGGLVSVVANPLGLEWTNMPAALTELFSLTNARTKVDLTNASSVRLVVNVLTAGVAGSKLRAQYSTDAGATWHYLDGATGPEAAIDATGVTASATVNLEAGAKADVLLRVVGISGDGATDPVFGLIMLQFDAVNGGGGGGGGGAPTTSTYVTTTADAGLSAEVVRQWLANYFEDTYPASPTAYDDEFDDTSGNSGSVNGLNARWTWLDQGTSTLTFQKNGWADLNVPANTGDHVRGLYQTAPAGDWTIEMKCTISAWSVNYALGGIMLRDGAGGVIYTLHIRHSASTTLDVEGAKWTNTTTFSTAFFAAKAIGLGSATTYFRASYTSASKNIDFYVSHDGIGWQYLTFVTASAAITQFGFFFNETNNKGGSHIWVDYFRKVTTALGGAGDA